MVEMLLVLVFTHTVGFVPILLLLCWPANTGSATTGAVDIH
jgi:hypothetical protein